MKIKSLANKAPFLPNVGVAVNREMMVWDKGEDGNTNARTTFVTAWDGRLFRSSNCSWYNHACEIPQKKMRPMTPKECALLPHGTMFKYDVYVKDVFVLYPIISTVGICKGYCLPADLADNIVSSPWKPLEVEE
jgi:hypothetical protein